MDSSNNTNEVTHNFPPFFRVYKDGHVERYMPSPYLPPPQNDAVSSKDTLISSLTNLKARVIIPTASINGHDRPKLPLVVHYHGGGFCIGSAFGSTTAKFLTSLVSGSNTVAVSVGYRLAPEDPLPAAYDDVLSAFQWIMSHSNGFGPDPWINDYVDFNKVFLLGESAGANLAHYVAVRAGVLGYKPRGLLLVHPYFAGTEPDQMIKYLYPGSAGTDQDPRLNPKNDPELGMMGCDNVLVHVAENDGLRGRGLGYCEILRKSSWGGKLELVENKGEGHCFYLFNPTSENVGPLMQKLCDFINQD